MNSNMTGAFLMMASMASFVANDTLLKLTGGDMPLWQLLFLRSILTSLLVLGLAKYLGALHLRMSARDWFWVSMRAVTEIGAAYFIVTALLLMSLADVTAILQALPLTVSLAAFVFFREPLGWRRLAAIGLGFIGMLLMVRPGTEGFDNASFYALAAVFFVTMRDITTRQIGPDVPSLTVTLTAAMSVLIFSGLASIPQGWGPVTPQLWALIVGSAIAIFGGYYFSIQVVRHAEMTFTAPFRYSSLVFALVVGWFVFGDWPDALTFLGASIVVAAGLFTFWREARTPKQG